MNQASQFGAHELVGMNEALMTKSANAELLSFLSQQVQDQQLQTMLDQHAHASYNHYMQGVSLLQGQTSANQQIAQNSQMAMHAQPKLGLRQPSMPQPNINAGIPSERSICTIALNLHKSGAVAWTTLALECADPQLRTYLMAGANMCDKMAYEIWTFMNQKGYYQVPTLQQNTTQTMIHQYQMPQPMQGIPAMQAQGTQGQLGMNQFVQ